MSNGSGQGTPAIPSTPPTSYAPSQGFYNELTRLDLLRGSEGGTWLDTTGTIDDELMFAIIRETSKDITDVTNRRFVPSVETRAYDSPRQMSDPLYFDDDVLELLTLTNGDGTAFTTGEYKVYPLNRTPRHYVKILGSSSHQWRTDNSGNKEGAISASVVLGYHTYYTAAWQSTQATLAAAITDPAATTFACTTGKVKRGMLLKIDDEYLYAAAVALGTTDTVTCARGVNGSTAATHVIGSTVYVWTPEAEIEVICRRASAGRYRQRANPTGETIVIEGVQFQTPKDVTAYIANEMARLGLVRTGLG